MKLIALELRSLRFALLNVQILHFQCVTLDKRPSWFDLVTHKNRKYFICFNYILN